MTVMPLVHEGVGFFFNCLSGGKPDAVKQPWRKLWFHLIGGAEDV